MKPIGGFFELESYHGKEYYPELIKLNTARNCFEYILRTKQYKKVYLPRYTCDVMLEPINKLGIGYEFYSINESFDPIFDQKVSDDECFVYNNYFGLKNKTVERLAGKINNLVVDNAQAFFSRPLENVDTIYSIRKFFGVPDVVTSFLVGVLTVHLALLTHRWIKNRQCKSSYYAILFLFVVATLYVLKVMGMW